MCALLFKAQVVLLVAKCGDSTSPDVQLTVIKTLLTITTAEHFRVHGDCLVQVRPLCARCCSSG
jgi:hypothetical protein